MTCRSSLVAPGQRVGVGSCTVSCRATTPLSEMGLPRHRVASGAEEQSRRTDLTAEESRRSDLPHWSEISSRGCMQPTRHSRGLDSAILNSVPQSDPAIS
jgi:hypothetical protein